MSQLDKITDIDQLRTVLEGARGPKKTIVLCHGVFDLLHVGHIRHFNEAKKLGDVLVVSLSADQFVHKGPNRPAFPEQLRAESIAALESVDYVIITRDASAEKLILALKPNFYVKGKDYKNRAPRKGGKLELERHAVETVGGEMVFTNEEMFSSSKLINTYLSPFSEDVTNYLSRIKEKYSAGDVESYLTKIRDLKVLVVGEAILDEYAYCEVIGKAGKEPVLVARHRSNEMFLGGTLAIANHVAAFSDNVSVLTFLGDRNREEEFIRSFLRPNISPIFLNYQNRPTITKRRYVEHYMIQKMFEVYYIEDEKLKETEAKALQLTLEQELSQYDVVIVADYGHGMLTDDAVDLLTEKARFLAVNTQANAGNTGLHTISCYPRADYISLSYGELCLELRKRDGQAREMIAMLLERVECNKITITRGRYGMITYDSNYGFVEAPGLTDHVVDRIGSGDAVLSISSLFAALDAPPELLTLVGSVAGVHAVRTVGNRNALEYASFLRHIESLLK